jgi:hypothetical protein
VLFESFFLLLYPRTRRRQSPTGTRKQPFSFRLVCQNAQHMAASKIIITIPLEVERWNRVFAMKGIVYYTGSACDWAPEVPWM